MYTLEQIKSLPLDEVEQLAQRFLVELETLEAYLALWNAGPHFTRAVWRDGAIRLIDSEAGTYEHAENELEYDEQLSDQDWRF